MNRALFVGAGLGVWAIATLAFRLAGHIFFLIEQPAVMVILYGVAAVGVAGIALGLFTWQGLEGTERFEAGALLALPGMLLDAGVVAFFPVVFPNMDPATAALFGSWLLWAYAFALVAALIPAATPR